MRNLAYGHFNKVYAAEYDLVWHRLYNETLKTLIT